jgi:hypothetical protein
LRRLERRVDRLSRAAPLWSAALLGLTIVLRLAE